MSFSRYVHFFNRLFHQQFFYKIQTYLVSYQVIIKNNSTDPTFVTLVAPLPVEREEQRIITLPSITPTPQQLSLENSFGNHYAVFCVNIQPRQEEKLTINFTLRVKPTSRAIFNLGKLNDYKTFPNQFLQTPHIQNHDPEIVSIAQTLAGEEKDLAILLKKINAFVIERLRYGTPIPGLYSALEALRNTGTVDCGGYDTLFAALCMAVGIPARIVSGFWAGYDTNTMHAWVEVQLPDGTWLPADPSIEQLSNLGRTKKYGRLGAIGSDRIILSVGSDFEVAVDGPRYPNGSRETSKKIAVDILQHPYVQTQNGSDLNVETTVTTTQL